ncbi:AMP-binding protein [Vibrio salinus]|uniref:AMP-binding protein n=1 Tax=Vibrio salinus TaxID=2899784 RepID=UPI001E5EA07C|nr:AMP-binding protein [Vibrio salinus]MCE0494325.1 AMP-binding protein [Vibrio salinus]
MVTTPEISSQLLTPDEHLSRWAKDRPDEIYLKQIINRQFHTYTFADVMTKSAALANGLKQLGAAPGDKVAIISKNCAEWFIYDFACMLGHFISVPIFPTTNRETISYCLKHSETTFLFVGKLDSTQETEQALEMLPNITTISFPYPLSMNCRYQYEDIIRQSNADLPNLKAHEDDDIMSIVYTSGTSGTPKGAILSYSAFTWSVNQITNLIGIEHDDRLFSYLPLSHITERVYILGTSIETGLSVAFPESLDTFINDVKMQQPTLFLSVPRLWTLFQQRITSKISPLALSIALKTPFVRQLIKNRIAQELGLDKARVLGCGSAPISPTILKWYHQLGLHITEAWGMTESLALGSLNFPYNKKKLGSIGVAAPGVTFHIADDGELLVQSKGLFSGYYKQPYETHEAFTSEGWLRTGDLGEKDTEDYLYILGRKADSFKTAKGKFVSPQPIEHFISEKLKLESLCLIGSGQPSPILLIVPFKFKKMDQARYEKSISAIIHKINEKLDSHEQIKGVLIAKEDWSVENEILTPTLKIKRRVLENKYQFIASNWPKNQLIIWEK